MSKRRTQRDIINSALHSAIQWELGYIDAMRGCGSTEDLATVQHSKDLIKDYREVLKKKYGAGM